MLTSVDDIVEMEQAKQSCLKDLYREYMLRRLVDIVVELKHCFKDLYRRLPCLADWLMTMLSWNKQYRAASKIYT